MKRKKPLVLPDDLTYGQAYDPAIQLAKDDPAAAAEWFAALVEHHVRLSPKWDSGPHTIEEATAMEKSNIGYFAGYYGEAERRKVAEVYGAIHPVFGNNFAPTAVEALAAGAAMVKG